MNCEGIGQNWRYVWREGVLGTPMPTRNCTAQNTTRLVLVPTVRELDIYEKAW